jgi:hypothetical protein
MEICNILFIQKEDHVEGLFTSDKQQIFVETILKDHSIGFRDQGFSKAILDCEDYCGFITVTNVRIESSIEVIKKLLEANKP